MNIDQYTLCNDLERSRSSALLARRDAGKVPRISGGVLNDGQKLSYAPVMIDASLISRVKTLSLADRLELIGVVWETLSSTEVPVTEAEKKLLDSRLADMENKPEDQSLWSDVQARLRRLIP